MRYPSEVLEAREAILARKLFQPEAAIILGSGLGALAEQVEHPFHVPYENIPHFPKTYAAGHAGQLVLGYLSGVPVVLMQGRSHLYEGWRRQDATFGLRCMHALGAESLIVTNAAGGLNPRYRPGDLMVIDSHIDLLWPRRGSLDLATKSIPPAPVTSAMGSVGRGTGAYCYELITKVLGSARKKNIVLHQGCYLATLGPTYETRSEYKMFREFGADAVGMSTVPEVLVATQLGMQILAFSVITNVASTDVPQNTTHEEVVETGNAAGPKLMSILQELLEELAGCPD